MFTPPAAVSWYPCPPRQKVFFVPKKPRKQIETSEKQAKKGTKRNESRKSRESCRNVCGRFLFRKVRLPKQAGNTKKITEIGYKVLYIITEIGYNTDITEIGYN